MYAVFAKVSSILPERIFDLFRKDYFIDLRCGQYSLNTHAQLLFASSTVFLYRISACYKQYTLSLKPNKAKVRKLFLNGLTLPANECLLILKFVFVVDNLTTFSAVSL